MYSADQGCDKNARRCFSAALLFGRKMVKLSKVTNHNGICCLTYETELVLSLTMLENSVLLMG